MKRLSLETDRRLYLGVTLRMMLVGPVLILALALPPVAPFEWRAVGAAMALFGVLAVVAVLGARRPEVRSTSVFVVFSMVVAIAAAGLAVVASQDEASPAALAIIVAMAFQLSARRGWVHSATAWVLGSLTYGISQSALGVPADHVATRTIMFAGVTGVLLMAIHFLVSSAYASRTEARHLAELARAAAAARELAEGVRVGEQVIKDLTGADRVDVWFEHEGAPPPESPDRVVVPLGLASRGPASLLLWGVRRHAYVRAVADLFAQLCERDRVLGDLLRHSRTDAVTGLANRRVLDEAIARGEPESPRTVVMVDLDHFKDFNDRYGHLAGDELLGRFARTLEAHVRPGDHVSRYGGEEFCLLLQADLAVAEDVVARIRSAWQLQDEAVTFSAGIARERSGGPEIDDEALARADHALYRAKAAGRDCSMVDLD